MLHPFLKNKLPELIDILKSHKVKRAYAFGSVCTKDFNDNSDVDLLIAFEDNLDPLEKGTLYFDLDDQLSKLLNRHVDLVSEIKLKNPYFIKVMSKTKTPLYE